MLTTSFNKSIVKQTFDEGDISGSNYNVFAFPSKAFLYAENWFLLSDDFLKKEIFLNILDQKVSFHGVP